MPSTVIEASDDLFSFGSLLEIGTVLLSSSQAGTGDARSSAGCSEGLSVRLVCWWS
jgi:hypothetical protein